MIDPTIESPSECSHNGADRPSSRIYFPVAAASSPRANAGQSSVLSMAAVPPPPLSRLAHYEPMVDRNFRVRCRLMPRPLRTRPSLSLLSPTSLRDGSSDIYYSGHDRYPAGADMTFRFRRTKLSVIADPFTIASGCIPLPRCASANM